MRNILVGDTGVDVNPVGESGTLGDWANDCPANKRTADTITTSTANKLRKLFFR
jgi:hypothetical protein